MICNVAKKGNGVFIYEIQIEKNSQTWQVQRNVEDFKKLFIDLN